jgi:hypothetical protein
MSFFSQVAALEKIDIVVFWVMIPCSLVGKNLWFRETYHLHFQGRSDLYPEDGGSMFLKTFQPDDHWC